MMFLSFPWLSPCMLHDSHVEVLFEFLLQKEGHLEGCPSFRQLDRR